MTTERVDSNAIAEALKAVGVPDESIQETIQHYESQPGQADGERPPSTETTPGDGEPEKPLTRAELTELLASHADGLTKKFQSVTDRDRQRMQDEVNRRLTAIENAKLEAELSNLPVEQQLARRIERLEGRGAPAQTQNLPIKPEQILQYVDSFGIKRDDSRLDWGNDATDFATGFGRLLASIDKIQKEDHGKASKTAIDKAVSDVRKKLGADKVPGTGPSSDADYKALADAFIANPDDPKIRERYLKARAAKGY